MRNPRNDPLDAHVPERTCILTRRTASREELVRLALGPDGKSRLTSAPALRAEAPGLASAARSSTRRMPRAS